ncbi:MAG: CBS domain-containing protein, partial [Gammaproteobacteria bacterium]
LSPLATLLFWLGPINIVLAIFNLVPGFPLDGGRVLRAALWGATGDRLRATRWASGAGRAFAWLLIGTGFAMVLGVSVPLFGTGLGGGLWLMLIGWFLHNAAVMSYRQLLIRESLLDVPVARLMRRGAASVPPRLPIREFVEDYLLGGDQRAFTVEEDERLLGLVCLKDVHRLPRSEWDVRTVADIMTPTDRLEVVSSDADGLAALNALGRRNVNQVPVVDRGRVVGIVTREDVLRWLSVYGDPELGQ